MKHFSAAHLRVINIKQCSRHFFHVYNKRYDYCGEQSQILINRKRQPFPINHLPYCVLGAIYYIDNHLLSSHPFSQAFLLPLSPIPMYNTPPPDAQHIRQRIYVNLWAVSLLFLSARCIPRPKKMPKPLADSTFVFCCSPILVAHCWLINKLRTSIEKIHNDLIRRPHRAASLWALGYKGLL